MILRELKSRYIKDLGPYYEDEKELLSHFWMLTEEFYSLSRLDFALNPDKEIAVSAAFFDAVERLKKHEPIQYITGYSHFYGRRFKVDKSVLIPRPETEELVSWIVNDADGESLEILDIATGSGCIAISLDLELKDCKIRALDVSDDALKTARTNKVSLGSDITLHKADALNLNSDEFFNSKKWDIIVSNPPYVKEDEKDEMKSNVLNYEPHLALFVANEDPLIFYREILKYAKTNLKKGGKVYFEINQYLLEETTQMATGLGFKTEEARKDFRANDRMLKLTLE